jgi:hypothetical protein
LLLVHGIYHWRPQRVAFRNDYCLFCAQPMRSVQIRTLDAWHFMWIPLLPLGYRKRWLCSTCGQNPHLHPGTRRGFKWAGVFVLLFFAVAFWAVPLTPDILILGWAVRVATPPGALLTLIHLLRTPADPSLKNMLSAISPAADTLCPFCGTHLLVVSSHCSCPACGVLRL